VAAHCRRVARRIGARRRVEIRVADSARGEPHQDLAGTRLRQLDVLHDEGLPELLEYGGTHPHACTP
jgi:hypothetical protein